MARPRSPDVRASTLSMRVSARERKALEARAAALGHPSVSAYLRALARADRERDSAPSPSTERPVGQVTAYHRTDLGTIWNGDSRDWMARAPGGSVNLILTSPPFGLLRKKAYGNEDAHAYCDWFRPFAEGFHTVLAENGSLVIDIGGAWKPGLPSRSLYHFELLVMLCEEYGFHLCLEHYWWNPARLPTPVEWVNIRRIRPKDAVNCVWWLAKTPWPKASNRRVLTPYSRSMRALLANGYDAKARPSGHVISDRFQRDNGGAIPPNLLAIANTESNGTYQDRCRARGLAIHPARFPAALPEYFIRMLTDPGDLVLDPFAGSCVTGFAAEKLGRKWACVEINAEYLPGAATRFTATARSEPTTSEPRRFSVYSPCTLPPDDAPLAPDGGRTRATADPGSAGGPDRLRPDA